MPDVARGIKKSNFKKKWFLKKIKKNDSPFGLAVWPAIDDIYESEELYYVD